MRLFISFEQSSLGRFFRKIACIFHTIPYQITRHTSIQNSNRYQFILLSSPTVICIMFIISVVSIISTISAISTTIIISSMSIVYRHSLSILSIVCCPYIYILSTTTYLSYVTQPKHHSCSHSTLPS